VQKQTTHSAASLHPAAAATSSSRKDFAGIAFRYAEDVVAGTIDVCLQVRQACQRHIDDLDRSAAGDFGFIFRPDSGARVCEFIEALPHVKGKWAAKRENIRLEPWQIFIVVSLFGWVERDEPTRYRFTDAYICVPRKNGKTALAAGIELYKFAADDEFAAEVYIGATSEDQAKRTGFSAARTMAMRSPGLCKAFGIQINVKSLVRDSDGSVLKPVISKPGDGDSPSCAALEEYHEHPTAELHDTMKTGMGARENPLLFAITTAGTNRSYPCYALQREIEQMLAGTRPMNERLFGIIYTIDAGDDWQDEAVLRKANPNYGISVDPQRLRDDQLAAVQSARKQNTFKTKHLNIWVNASVSWMNMSKWDELADPTLKLEDFVGEDCIAAFDLASRIDLVAKILLFRRFEDDGMGSSRDHFYAFCTSYLNAARVEDSKGQHYAAWAEDGHLVVTPGNETDYNWIADDLVEDAQHLRLLQIPHDPHHAAALIQFIRARDDWRQDAEFVEIPQTRASYSPAMKELEALVLSGRLHHTGDPVLSWAIANVVAEVDNRDNIFPTKEAPENKIDPAVALMMAVRQWTLSDVDGSRPSIEVIEAPATKKKPAEGEQSAAEKRQSVIDELIADLDEDF
jgi:phage terminase large subunit-like protein